MGELDERIKNTYHGRKKVVNMDDLTCRNAKEALTWAQPVRQERNRAEPITMERSNTKWKTENRDQYRKFVEIPNEENQAPTSDPTENNVQYQTQI